MVCMIGCGGGGGGGQPDARPDAEQVDAGPDASTDPAITATVALTSAGPGTVTCVPGDGIRITARKPGMQTVSDVYPCDTAAVRTPPLPTGPGSYEVWVDYINDRGNPSDPTLWVVVGETEHVTVDVTGDTSIAVDLVLANGFFDVSWSVRDAGGTLLTSCAQIPGENGVSVLGTLIGPNTATEDIYHCEDGFTAGAANPVTSGLMPLGDYVFSLSVLDASDLSLGQSAATSGSLVDGNDYTDLGVIEIQLD